MMWKKTRVWGNKDIEETKMPIEEPLTIRINGRKLTTTMVSPGMKKEFVIGHLISQGIVKDREGIDSIRIQEREASVIAETIPFEETKEVIVSGCGGGSNLLEDSPIVDSNKEFSLESINESMISMLKNVKEGEGVHVAALYNEKNQLLVKDIGRHNCIDKIIGAGIKKQIDFSESYIVSTGRLSSDMVLKCSNAGIPAAASHKSTTTLAKEIAEKTNISLIIYAGKNPLVLTDPEKIEH